MVQKSQNNKRLALTYLIFASLFLTACGAEQASKSNPNLSRRLEEHSAPANAASNTSMSTVDMAAPGLNESFSNEKGVRSAEKYAEITENPFFETTHAPLSTFSIDVDTASYANARRMLTSGIKPHKNSVRIEEFINYFDYEYPQPSGDVPFSVNTEVAASPWNSKNKLIKIGLQGKNVALDNLPPSNLVFLLDVSGSMNEENKLPLLKQSLKVMLNELNPKDRVAIVVYAGSSGLVLPSTSVTEREKIESALDRLEAGGSTNGGQGIQLAYATATENFIRGGNNRVILATDGDFNVGLRGDGELVSMIEEKRKTGVFLSVLAFGSGNLNDSMMEKLTNAGNGNYSYIDTLSEARKALGSQIAGTLYTIAKDVKIQVEFNPAKVAGYRLIGYENRLLAAEDFANDKKDAGDIGAGHSVTALYEIVPAGQKVDNGGIELKYSKVEPTGTAFSNELATVKLRYKQPDGDVSRLLSVGVLDNIRSHEEASQDFRFAAAVAQFGMILRDSKYKGDASYDSVTRLAQSSVGPDLRNYRKDFLKLVNMAKNS